MPAPISLPSTSCMDGRHGFLLTYWCLQVFSWHRSPDGVCSPIADRLEAAFSTARLNIAEAHERQKLYYDEGSCHHPFELDGLVWLHNPTESRMKLAPHWRGPYRVVQVLVSGGEAALTYRIINLLDPMEQAQVVHHDRLKPYTLPLPAQATTTTPVVPVSPSAVQASPSPQSLRSSDQLQSASVLSGRGRVQETTAQKVVHVSFLVRRIGV